jgi:methyl-accepting chemotaxis protein
MKLSFKLMLLNSISSLFLAVILVGITALTLNHEMEHQAQSSQEKSMRVAWQLLHEKGNDFKVVDGQLVNDTYVISNNFELVDKIKELVGGTATIFMGDTRVATNVMKPDGTRAIGTHLAKGPVYDTVITQGKPYRGQTDILGVPFFTAYDPIKNSAGEVVGILYVGVKKAEFFSVLEGLILQNLGFAILVVLFTSGAVYLFTRTLLKPLQQFERSMASLAGGQGDLTQRLPATNTNDEFAVVTVSFNQFMDGLQALVKDLLAQSAQISQFAAGFTSVSEQVARGSAHQNEAVQEIVSSVDNMAASITVVAQSAEQAENIAFDAGTQAQQGKDVVQEASAEINRIADSVSQIAQTVASLGERSNEISGIVQVIREIADQTNLLALNAAIEAARAGEQGRGFAVVADEVRKLAERTSKATQEIGGMIGSVQAETQTAVNLMEQGIAQVRQGVQLANQAGDSLTQINQGSIKTKAVIEEIAGATRQGLSASMKINQSVIDIKQMTQNRVEIGQRIADSAQQLAQVAVKLNAAVSRFRV